MDWLSLGIGGFVGALAAAAVAALRVRAAFEAFGAEFHEYIAGKNDAASVSLASSFEVLSSDVGMFSSAFDRLKRAFKWKLKNIK